MPVVVNPDGVDEVSASVFIEYGPEVDGRTKATEPRTMHSTAQEGTNGDFCWTATCSAPLQARSASEWTLCDSFTHWRVGLVFSMVFVNMALSS